MGGRCQINKTWDKLKQEMVCDIGELNKTHA